MRTWLIWVGAFVVLALLGGLHHSHGVGDPVSVVVAVGFIVWVGAGVLLALRAVLRFLRR